MFEKISRLAERAATNGGVSRRGFLGRLGRAALGAAGVVGGLSALSGSARAGQHDLYACSYSPKGGKKCAYSFGCYDLRSCGGCPPYHCCTLVSKTIIGTC